jgi:hypothetical protein
LIQVIADNFVAGLVLDHDGIIRHAAPILAYMRGRHIDHQLKYCLRKGWTVLTVLP